MRNLSRPATSRSTRRRDPAEAERRRLRDLERLRAAWRLLTAPAIGDAALLATILAVRVQA